MRLLKQMAFRDLHAHRFWLDVKQLNTRALALYASEGFVEEGRLRESVRVSIDGADGYDSLVVMSMLDREYQARVALDQEGDWPLAQDRRKSTPNGRRPMITTMMDVPLSLNHLLERAGTHLPATARSSPGCPTSRLRRHSYAE